MNSNIFVPKKINVGYQNRESTYTGKLAYVIYYDEKGKLRKEASWNSWRDKNIPNEEFNNVPISGFVLNKKAGDYSTGWNHRQAYCRVYDPRNFEFEITIENLLYILENTNSIKGKGLEGEFVYGWSGKDLILMPVESPDYKEIQKYNEIVHKNKTINVKDLIIGATYLSRDNVEYVYMGKFDKYDYGYWKNGNFFKTRSEMIKWCIDNNIPKTRFINYYGWHEIYKEDQYDMGNVGKQYCFYHKRKTYDGDSKDAFYWTKSLGKNFIDIVNAKCCENYADLFFLLEGTVSFSPIHKFADKYFPMSFEEFYKKITYQSIDGSILFYNRTFMVNYNGEYEKCKITPENKKEDKFRVYICNEELINIFPTEEKLVKNVMETHMIPVSLKTIYKTLKPVYKQIYLENGREYEKEYTL